MLLVYGETFSQSHGTKKPITHEAIWLMHRVGAPAPSPDGKWVAVPVVEPAYDEKDQLSDLWLASVDGGATPRRLTYSKGSESDLAWSPDSRKLAFAAKREGDEANQIYVLDLEAGGEALRITSLSTGASNPEWSPDGKRLLFTSIVYPGAADDEANRKIAAERKERKYNARIYEGFPIRYWDKWLEDTQIHLFVQGVEPGSKARDLLAGSRLVNQPGFAGKSTTSGQTLEAVWAPDGESIVFVATTEKDRSAFSSVATHLFQISAAKKGEPKQVTSGRRSYSKPAFAPDGGKLYCIASEENDKVYNLDRLTRVSWPSPGQPETLSASFDRSVGSFAVSPDSRTVYLLAEEAGHEKLFSLPASGGVIRPAFDMSSGVYTNLSIPTGTSKPLLIANWESAVNPAQAVRIDLPAGRNEVLIDFNQERVRNIDWQPLEHFWFTSKEGRPIHNLLAFPPEFDRRQKYPLLVLIHGGPHSMWRDHFFLRWNYHLLAQPGFVVLMTNYTGSTGFGEKFAQEIQLDPFGRCGREINEAADEAIRRFPFIDGSRQAAAGASYGGHLVNWLQATATRYRCLISHAGLVNLESQWGTGDIIYRREVNNGGPVWEQGKVWREQNPIRFAKDFRTPILLTVGENDFRVPLNQTLENWSVLQRLQIPSRLIVFPEENHWIQKGENSRFFYQELHAWLKKYLTPSERVTE